MSILVKAPRAIGANPLGTEFLEIVEHIQQKQQPWRPEDKPSYSNDRIYKIGTWMVALDNEPYDALNTRFDAAVQTQMPGKRWLYSAALRTGPGSYFKPEIDRGHTFMFGRLVDLDAQIHPTVKPAVFELKPPYPDMQEMRLSYGQVFSTEPLHSPTENDSYDINKVLGWLRWIDNEGDTDPT